MHPELFLGGGGVAESKAIYNLCVILKAMLWKPCHNLRADSWLGYKEN
jgi:hypothetical protein